MAMTCPACGGERQPGPECPLCGVIYAKAEARAVFKAKGEASAEPYAREVQGAVWAGDLEDARTEMKLRIWALPAAVLFARLLVATGMGHMLSRLFLSMWIHELGHAVTAWMCGFGAFPGPWATMIAEERSVWVAIFVFAAIVTAGFFAVKARNFGWATVLAIALCFQIYGSRVLTQTQAQSWITFGGDGGCFVLGSMLMATFFSKVDSKLRRDWLRWGLLVIGVFAFMDAWQTWFSARNDFSEIPFGAIEGVGLSDPSKLTEQFGWGTEEMIRRYLNLAGFCSVGVVIAWGIGLWRAHQDTQR